MRAEDGHLLAVSAVGGAAGDFVLCHAKSLGQRAQQARGVECRERGHLAGLQARIKQRHQTGEVGGVEDNHHMLHVGTVALDVLAQILGNLAVAGEQVLAGHALPAWSAATGDDVLGTSIRLGGVGGGGDFHVAKATVAHLLGHALGREHVVEADVIGQTHHQGSLYHVGANHAGCADDDELVVS